MNPFSKSFPTGPEVYPGPEANIQRSANRMLRLESSEDGQEDSQSKYILSDCVWRPYKSSITSNKDTWKKVGENLAKAKFENKHETIVNESKTKEEVIPEDVSHEEQATPKDDDQSEETTQKGVTYDPEVASRYMATMSRIEARNRILKMNNLSGYYVPKKMHDDTPANPEDLHPCVKLHLNKKSPKTDLEQGMEVDLSLRATFGFCIPAFVKCGPHYIKGSRYNEYRNEKDGAIYVPILCLLDTGASLGIVNKESAKALGLKPNSSGIISFSTITDEGKPTEVEEYFANLMLFNEESVNVQLFTVERIGKEQPVGNYWAHVRKQLNLNEKIIEQMFDSHKSGEISMIIGVKEAVLLSRQIPFTAIGLNPSAVNPNLMLYSSLLMGSGRMMLGGSLGIDCRLGTSGYNHIYQDPKVNNKTPRYKPELFCQILYEDYFNSNPQGSIKKKDMIEMIALKNKEIEDTISNPSSV